MLPSTDRDSLIDLSLLSDPISVDSVSYSMCFFTALASSISVQDLKASHEVLVHLGSEGGRHTGILVDEYLLEQ